MKTFEEHYRDAGLDDLRAIDPGRADLVKRAAALFWDRALLEVLSLPEAKEITKLLITQQEQPGDF